MSMRVLVRKWSVQNVGWLFINLSGLVRFLVRNLHVLHFVKCSKGLIFVPCQLTGEKLGYAAHVPSDLDQCCRLQLEDALTLDEIAEKVEAGQLDFLHPLEIGTGGSC